MPSSPRVSRKLSGETRIRLAQEVQVLGGKHIVIGVMADSLMTSLKTAPVKTAYVHFKNRPPITASFVVRGRGWSGDELLTPPVRAAISNSAPSVTIARVKTSIRNSRTRLRASAFRRRF